MATAGIHRDLKVDVSHKQILSIALPITLSILIPQVNWLTNAIFLGQLSTEALANAGITGVFYLIFAVAGNGLNAGMQNVFSREAGAGKTSRFSIILSQGIIISLVFSTACILFTWLVAPTILSRATDPLSYKLEMSFLRIRIIGLPFLFLFQMGNAFLISSLNSRWLLVGFITETVTNILFDYVLIFGKAGFPQMGFNGAAWASVIAEFLSMISIWLVLLSTGLRKEYKLLHRFSYNPITTGKILNISLPLVLQYIMSVSTWFIFFLLIEARGIIAKAISNTMRNVFGLAGVFVWSFASTCNTIVSNLMGQHREEMVLIAIKRIMYWSLGCSLVLASLLNIFPHYFFSLFGQPEEFVQTAIPVIRVVGPGILLMSMANVWLNGVTGTGKTRVNLVIEFVAISLYMGYTWYFMKLHYVSLAVAWSNEFVYWSAIFLMSFLYLKKGKWRTSPGVPNEKNP
ncbi:MAG: MATE family efflux transporter [Ferruginibacter sp.]